MTLAELRAQRATVQSTMDKILESKDLSEDERAEFDSAEENFHALSTDINTAEELAVEDDSRRKRAQDRRSHLAASAGRAASIASPHISNPTPAWLNDAKRGFENHRDFLLNVMDAARLGYTKDERLLSLRASDKFAAAGSDEQSTIADPYGGYLVPTGLAPGVLSVPAEVDPIASHCTMIPMENPVVEINARTDKNHTSSVSGGLRVYRRSETASMTSSRMEFEQVTLRATGLFGIAYASEELLERSPVSFLALLEAGFRDEFGSKLLNEKISGTGAGQFEGILNTPALVDQTKETGQAATTIVYENVIKMRARCYGYGKAVWLANHDTLPQLMLMNQSVGTGGVVVWQPSAREDHPDLLLGRPIYFSEYAKTLGTSGDLILADWSQYLVGTLSAPRTAESMHVRFENHERTFKFWLENDGRSWWRSALTPVVSSTTLSPFVTLATRA